MVRDRILSAVFLFAVAGCAPKNISPPTPPPPIAPTPGECPGASALENIQVTMNMGESNFPEIAWNGKMFVMAWWDDRSAAPEIYTIGMTREGYEAAPQKKIPGNGWAKNPTLAFDGIETHLVWSEEPKILSTRLGNGDPEIRTLAEKGALPSAGAWGGAVWVSGGLLYFRSDGMTDLKTRDPRPPQVIASGGIETPRMAYNGIYYAVIWSESVSGGRRIAMQRVSPQGEKLGNVVAVSQAAGYAKNPAIVWNGKRFAAAWTDTAPSAGKSRNPYPIFFALIPEVGDAPLMSRQSAFSSASDQVTVATSGEEYALSWVGDKDNGGCAIYFQRLDVNSNPLEETIQVSDGNSITCSRPSLAWDGKGYAAAWHDDRGQMESEVYFAYIACGKPGPAVPKQNPPEEPKAEEPKAEEPKAPSDLPALKEAF